MRKKRIRRCRAGGFSSRTARTARRQAFWRSLEAARSFPAETCAGPQAGVEEGQRSQHGGMGADSPPVTRRRLMTRSSPDSGPHGSSDDKTRPAIQGNLIRRNHVTHQAPRCSSSTRGWRSRSEASANAIETRPAKVLLAVAEGTSPALPLEGIRACRFACDGLLPAVRGV